MIANTFFVIRKKQTGLSSYLNIEKRPLVVPVFEADFLSTVFVGRNLHAVVKNRGELLCYVHGEIPTHISTFFLFSFFFLHFRKTSVGCQVRWYHCVGGGASVK